jgi:transcriptional regulator with AAA-type ATPase domain
MIPSSYTSPEGKKKKLPLEDKLDQVIQAVAEMRAINEIQFEHVDANIGQLKDSQEKAIDRIREDQKTGQNDIISVVKQLLETHIQGLKDTQERQNERIEDHGKKFDDLHDHVNSKLTYMDSKIDKHLLTVQAIDGRVDALEHAPDQKAAGWWRTVAGIGVGAVAGALIYAGIGWVETILKGAGK